MTVSGDAIVAEVEKFKGDAYVYGATGPSSFDCSGLVQYVLEKLGVKDVPRTSEEQWAWSQHIDKSQLAPGDLVFAQFPGDNASPGHVGVYIGNGNVLSAEDPAQGVGVSSLSSWGSAVVGYGRVPDSTAGTQSATLDSATTGILGLGDIAGPLGTIAGVFGHVDTLLTDIMSPGFWLRIGAFFAGIFLVAAGIWCLVRATDDSPLTPSIPATVAI